ncbi:MAG TPA: glycosyltransferase [Jatrophihabitans sp.]|nr:glycosyltransferase [Jatrophihabitans sp.]
MTGATAATGAAPRVVAVIVTYNRRELLLEALAALQAQSRPPDAVVVVDNASDDGTADAVREQYGEVRLVRLPTNTGGAGGFAAGLAIALDDGADLVWLMDDDTIPHPPALGELLRAREGYPGGRPALLASRVVWTDGRDHPMNTPRPKPLANRRERRIADALGCVPIRSASFVSVLVDAASCRERGLPIADYFLWNDDFEFTTRLLRGNFGLYCPSSVVVHKTAKFGSTDVDPGERFFYEVRNKVWMLTRSKSLGPLDRSLYTGATLRRWLRLLYRSANRRVLLGALRRGLLEGLRRGPRPTADVLAEAGVPASARPRG